jgi:hypothetical protein
MKNPLKAGRKRLKAGSPLLETPAFSRKKTRLRRACYATTAFRTLPLGATSPTAQIISYFGDRVNPFQHDAFAAVIDSTLPVVATTIRQ